VGPAPGRACPWDSLSAPLLWLLDVCTEVAAAAGDADVDGVDFGL